MITLYLAVVLVLVLVASYIDYVHSTKVLASSTTWSNPTTIIIY